MTPQMGMAEFFGMEAGEYLERLDALVSPAAAPNLDEFVRLARALRGSALMANQQPIAGAAAGLEAVARALRETKIAWDPGNRQITIRAVDDLKILIRAVSAWTPREDAKARGIAQELEQLAGIRASTRMQAITVADAGTRAFVAREGAALASALDRAAVALSQGAAPDQVQGILKVMQPLRGLAGLADLPPLPDVLDGLQRAVAEATRRRDAGAAAAAVFRAAAKALARAAREATVGAPAPESPELSEFVTELARWLEPEKDVVPIESLFFADQGPHILERGTIPLAPGPNVQVELVSQGDHLRQAADALDRATSDAQRTLRIQSLAGTLAALANAGVGSFGQAARDAIARGAALKDPAGFAARLREAGTLLSAAGQADPKSVTEHLERIATAMRTVGAAATTASRPAAPPPSAAVSAASAESVAENAAGLLGSLLRFQRYIDMVGNKPAPLAELLAGPPVLPTTADPATAVVPMESLCFSGRDALARALSLREQVRAALARPGGNAEAEALLEEIFDLVKLGQQN